MERQTRQGEGLRQTLRRSLIRTSCILASWRWHLVAEIPHSPYVIPQGKTHRGVSTSYPKSGCLPAVGCFPAPSRHRPITALLSAELPTPCSTMIPSLLCCSPHTSSTANCCQWDSALPAEARETHLQEERLQIVWQHPSR